MSEFKEINQREMGFMEKVRQKCFEQWYSRFGTSAKGGRYFQALRDPHYVLKDRSTNPVPGTKQTISYELFPFQTIYQVSDVKQLRELFSAATKQSVADDGSMHSAIGNYALWLRLVSSDEEWVNEPLWEGDEAPVGSGAKSRLKTLSSNGLDYSKALANRKATYMYDKYLAAIRTKPFVLLSGISGTGKSRLVRQLARGCCPEKDSSGNVHEFCNPQKPGNFELIPVRPNWHDSTELMGYVTRLSGTPEYVITPFVRFLAKAWQTLDVPFFLCLDEMNLAPVEHYFAEFLSVIETRRWCDIPDVRTAITTDPLIRIEDGKLFDKVLDALFEAGSDSKLIEYFKKVHGIPVPQNLVVVGTVNMDDTTCSFSRKVLDRAMSFELNDVGDMYDVGKIAGEGDLPFASIQSSAAMGKLISGKDACDANRDLCEKVLKVLESLNEGTEKDGERLSLLSGTPFKIAYRSRNEILIYCCERTSCGAVPLATALDEALSMKVLSRIEGDSQRVPRKWLEQLRSEIVGRLAVTDGYDKEKCTLCADKLKEMAEQSDSGYTSFWTR